MKPNGIVFAAVLLSIGLAPPALGTPSLCIVLPCIPVVSTTAPIVGPSAAMIAAAAPVPARELPDLRSISFDGEQRKVRGLRIHGLELGGDSPRYDDQHNPLDDSDDWSADDLFNWDLWFRARQDSLGVKAKYRTPPFVDSVTVGFKKYMDVPDLVGLEETRDSLYEKIGKKPEICDGYEFSIKSDIDPKWSVGYTRHIESTIEGETFESERGNYLWGAFNPLGKNDGEDWNCRIFGGVNHRTMAEDDDRTDDFAARRGSGFGYSLGVSFRQALDTLPTPLSRGAGAPEKRGVWFDQWEPRLSIADAAIDAFMVTAAARVTIYLTKHVRLIPEVYYDYFPSPDEDSDGGFGFSVSLAVRL